MSDGRRFAIGDLAELGGVSRRTVRYYVQEQLLPAPFGVGRGDHYGQVHLDRLLQVKALQEAGRSLDEIRLALRQTSPERKAPAAVASVEANGEQPLRTLWRRLVLADGVELHVGGNVRLPSPARLTELVAWCRANFTTVADATDD